MDATNVLKLAGVHLYRLHRLTPSGFPVYPRGYSRVERGVSRIADEYQHMDGRRAPVAHRPPAKGEVRIPDAKRSVHNNCSPA